MKTVEKNSDPDQFKPVAFVQTYLKLTEQNLPASNVLLAPSKRDASAEAGSAKVFVGKGSSAFVVNNGRQVCIACVLEKNSLSAMVPTQFQE